MNNKIEILTEILSNSQYTVALCGSGMLEEGGFEGITKQSRAYEIEMMYDASPEEIFSSVYFNTRPNKFFKFYKQEMLENAPHPTDSAVTLAALEEKGMLQCIITANIYEQCQRGGCKNVINLYGSVYKNKCQRCGKEYPLEYIMRAKDVPLCEECGAIIRPQVSLFGEQLDNNLMTKTVEEVSKAEVLLLLGTRIHSDVFRNYVRYFNGKKLVVIHEKEHFTDKKADLVILDKPMNVMRNVKI